MVTKTVAKTLLFNREDEFLAVHRAPNDAHRPNQWDFPGGRLNFGETADQALVREVYEEVGMLLLQGEAQLVWTHQNIVDGHNIIRLYFIGQALGDRASLSPEHDRYAWMTLSEGIERYEHAPQHQFLQFVEQNHLRPGAPTSTIPL